MKLFFTHVCNFVRSFWSVFLKAFENKATIEYPKHKHQKGKYFRGKHNLDTGKCVGCKGCARSCPNQCITIEENKFKIDYQKCCFCGLCSRACMRKALTMTGNEVALQNDKKKFIVNLKSEPGEKQC